MHQEPPLWFWIIRWPIAPGGWHEEKKLSFGFDSPDETYLAGKTTSQVTTS
jgi:hypothetical protein